MIKSEFKYIFKILENFNKKSSNCRSVPDQYAERLISEKVITEEEVKEIAQHQFNYYASELQHAEEFVPDKTYFRKQWADFVQAPETITIWDTGMSWEILSFIGRASVYHPPEFVSDEFNSMNLKFY